LNGEETEPHPERRDEGANTDTDPLARVHRASTDRSVRFR
jgi:hypothetical protein